MAKKEIKEAKTSQGITIKELENELKKLDFNLDRDSLEHLWNWFEFWYREDRKEELINEIVDYGKCICGMSEWAIYHEVQGGGKYHLICGECDKKCEGGETNRHNNYGKFESKECGAYVFWEKGKSVEKWYCETCKFDLLCGDCGSPHELDVELYSKGKYENFYICDDCELERYETEHEENHKTEPNLNCSLCEDFVDKWNDKLEEQNKKV